MTIEERIAEAEALNAKLRASHSVPKRQPNPIMRKNGKAYDPTIERNLCSYDWLSVVKPSFKAFCERTLNGTTPSMAEILNRKLKSGNAAIRSAMKPKGVNTLLGPYTTGRWVTDSHENKTFAYAETLKFIRVSKDEWSSEEPDPEVVSVPQNVPMLGQGKWPSDPTFGLDDDEEAQEVPQEAISGAQDERETLARVVAALEAQNALLRALTQRRVA